MSDEDVQTIVLPEDGLCEGCGEPIGEEAYETDDMVVICAKCWDAMLVEEIEEKGGVGWAS